MLNPTIMWIAIIGYLVAILAVSRFVSWNEKRKKGHYNVFKSKLSWPVLLMTYIASLMSVWTFFAGPGGYYRGGLTYWFSEITYIPMFIVAMYFSTNKVWLVNARRNYTTPSDCFCDRWGNSKVLRAVTGLVFLVSSFPYVTSVLVAISSATSVATGGRMNYTAVVLIIGVAMVVFTTIGGFKSVAWTDTFQGIAFIIALAVIAGAAVYFVGGGNLGNVFGTIWNNPDLGLGDGTTGQAWFSYPGAYWWTPYSARFGYPFSCLIGWCLMLPHVFVRSAYSGQDLHTQRRVMTFAPILQALVWTLTFIIGAVGIAGLPGMDSSVTEMIIPYIIEHIINPAAPAFAVVLMILFFVGATGVGISTADSFLLVAASIISDDFIIGIGGRKMSVKKKEMIGRLVILIIGIICVLLALNPPDLIYTLIMFAIAIVMPLFPVLMWGMYWRRSTKIAAIICSIVGSVLVLLTYFVWNLGGSWYGAIGFGANVVLMPIISLLTKPDDPKDSKEFFEALDFNSKKYYDIQVKAKA